MIFIMFDTENEANAANDKIYLNYFRDFVPQRNNFDGSLLNAQTWTKVPYGSLSDSQLLETFDENGKTNRVYPIFGETNNQLSEGAFTNGWDDVVNLGGKWGVKKPTDSYLLSGVSGYTEEDINQYIKYVPE